MKTNIKGSTTRVGMGARVILSAKYEQPTLSEEQFSIWRSFFIGLKRNIHKYGIWLD